MNESLQAIADAASPLHERLAAGFLPVEGDGNRRRCEERWKKWSETLSRDDADELPRRLKRSGIDPQNAKALLGDVRGRPAASPLAWSGIFGAAVASARDLPADEGVTEESKDPAAAWDAFHQPFMVTARRLLRERAGILFDRLSPAALADLEGALLRRLRNISTRALDVEFAINRAGIPGGIPPTAGEKADFARHSLNGGGFFKGYPGAARLHGLVVAFWVDAAAEFLARLEADVEDLERLFAPAALRGRIENITASLSDSHRGGRSVFIAAFEGGFKLVYKPRSLGLEAAYFEFVQWLNARECPLAMKIVRVLDRGDYGWMEFVAHEPCAIMDDAALFFERAGGLLALLYVLAGSDMHLENLIAHGAQPVPIDLEVLMVPHRGDIGLGEEDQALISAGNAMRHSVLSVGLLPSWMGVGKGKVYNYGGLGASDRPPDQPLSQPGAEKPPELHKPQFEGRAVSSHLHREAIVQGFRTMYDFLLRQRDDILRPSGPLMRFRNEPVRFVNRATAIYGRALRRSVTPVALGSGVLRSMELEIFMKSVLYAPKSEMETVHAVCEAEILAMEQGDVPFFQVRVDSRDLVIPETGTALKDFFTEDGFAIARQRFESLSADDLETQTKFIRLSFDLIGEEPPPVAAKPASRAFKARSFPDEALAISRTIREDAIRAAEDVTWIAPRLIPSTESFQLQPMSYSLYDGSLGVMIFLLAMEARLGDKASGDLGRQVFAAFQRNRSKPFMQALNRQSSPGLAGHGGQIYALLLGAKLSGMSDMLAAASELGEMITDDTHRRHKEFDIMSGAAGAIPALLALHSATGGRCWMEKAVTCGDHLLASREAAVDGRKSWKSMGLFLSGYSHGAAGCASSLLQLHAACGDERFREAAVEAIAYEDTLFDAATGNWKDLRHENAFMTSWCHGAPGILLGRLLGGEKDTEDVTRALRTTQAGSSNVDQCCCGNAGRADILLTAAAMLKNDGLRDRAGHLMEQSVALAHELHGYACYGLLPRTVRGPGFFQGLSGIGYTLLRMEFPSSLPSVLAMET